MNRQPDELFIRALFSRFLENRCSEQEIRLLMEYAEKEEYRALLSGLMEEAGMEDELPDELLYARHKAVIDAVGARITPPMPAAPAKTRRLWPYYAAAAVAALLLCAGAWRWYTRQAPAQQPLAVQQDTVPDLKPGGKKALLVLGNGASITLDSASSGVLTRQGHTQVIKAAGGNLVYNSTAARPEGIVYNAVITPRGGQYQVTLSDGTKVWLNAASSLRFPTAFTGNTRQVTLTGEAYFEVAKNTAQPFVVSVNDMQVTVLGTHFNIMAYREETAVRTTLLEGSVKVTQGNAATLLEPGQQARVDAGGRISLVRNADLNAAMAWRNQLFWFDNDDIQTVMRQLSREYDIDVEIRGDIRRHFTGSIPRNANVSTVFRVLQKTGGVHFTISDGKIIVTP